MEVLAILIMCCMTIFILSILIGFTPKNIKKIKQIGEDKELNELTNVLPDNEEICKEMLTMLKNEKVEIKNGSENAQASLYIVASNSILIANIKNTFTRVQTIAHECLHSIQDKKLLWFNFIFSNIYIIYFLIITLLSLLNIIKTPIFFASTLIMMSVVLFFVRSYLETDAMTKARFLAKEYMQGKKNLISEDNIDLIVENYDVINSIGIKITNLTLLNGYLIKVIVFCLSAMV